MAEYPESLFQEITDPRKRAFLAAYAHTGRITVAAKAAQTNWRNHYNWLRDDPVYAEAYATSRRMVGDFLEDEAIRRAKDGVVKPVYWQGQLIDEQRDYSDTLLIFLLKGARPETYRERYEHTGANGTPLLPPTVVVPDPSFFTDLAALFTQLGPAHGNGVHALPPPDNVELSGTDS